MCIEWHGGRVHSERTRRTNHALSSLGFGDANGIVHSLSRSHPFAARLFCLTQSLPFFSLKFTRMQSFVGVHAFNTMRARTALDR